MYRPRLQVLDLCHMVDSEAMTRAIADQARTIRIPVHMIETINKLLRRVARAGSGTGPRADIGRDCQADGHSSGRGPRAKYRAGTDSSLGKAPIGEEEDCILGDFIEDRNNVSPAEAVINLNLREQTEAVLRTLTPREEEKVIKMRFGVGDGSEHPRGGAAQIRGHS